MNKDELKAIYFSFYSQLTPEHAEKAKANYEEFGGGAVEPKNHKEAVNMGFIWSQSNQGEDYWDAISNQLKDKTYPLQLTPQKITVEVKEFTAPELTERMATEEDMAGLDKLVESISPPTEPNFGTESICQEAQRIQGGDRQQDYGSPAKNFQDIADLWNSYIAILGVDVDLKARDVAHMSILMKISRNVHKPKRDNWVDMAGYAQCGGKVDEL